MAYSSDLTRTKNWGAEILTDADLEGQLDLIITWVMAAMNETTGHKHDATENEAPKIDIANGLKVTSQAQGDIIAASSATAWIRIAKGTAQQALVMNAGATAPEFAGYAVPSGVIVAWSGAVSAIPTGWVICDGANGTPDLTDRFVLHADADAAGTNNVDETGGASAHTHDTVPTRTVMSGSVTNFEVCQAAGETSSSTSNVPKYHALAYIMKT